MLFDSRLNNGPPSRYDGTPSYWHNDPSISGGGCWAVEAAHGLDIFLHLVGDVKVTVVGAVMSNAIHRRVVEDSAMGMVRSENGVTGVIESGYTYPRGTYSGEYYHRAVGTRAMVFVMTDAQHRCVGQIHTASGIELFEELDGASIFRAVIADSLDALVRGTRPPATIGDAVRALEVQDAVYDFARRSSLTNGPYPMGAPPPRPA